MLILSVGFEAPKESTTSDVNLLNVKIIYGQYLLYFNPKFYICLATSLHGIVALIPNDMFLILQEHIRRKIEKIQRRRAGN